MQRADAALQPLVEQFADYMPNDFPDRFKVHVLGLSDWVVGSMGGTLYLIFGAVIAAIDRSHKSARSPLSGMLISPQLMGIACGCLDGILKQC